MAYNKFITTDGTVLLDLTDTSVTAETLAKDITAVDKNGNKIVGTMESGGDSAVPIEVSTEAEMTALLESGEVGGVYKYTGTTGTYENGALYVLEEDPLVGTWVFNDSIDLGDTNLYFDVTFLCEGERFIQILVVPNGDDEFKPNTLGYWREDWSYPDMAYYESFWENTFFQTIVITSSASEVQNAEVLLAFLQANAIKQ